MKNKIAQELINLHLEELDLEIKRSKAMTNVSSQIIKLSDLSLKVHEYFVEEYGVGKSKVPRLLLGIEVHDE